MIVQFGNEKVSNNCSIPITIDCNVVAFIVFEEGFHQPINRTKQSVFLDVTVFRHTLVYSFTPNSAVLFIDVAIQPEVCFIANIMKIDHYFRNKIAQFESVVHSLVVRASDSRPEGLRSMPDATKYPQNTHGFHAEIVEVEIGGVAIYRPFGEFCRAKSYCHLYGAQGQRREYF
ncbi:hypothetical protein TNCV_4691161 [Trichonephila clavipes]|nr:hypothetical protein TNCV_4691161 [Trichonephila clavipes]